MYYTTTTKDSVHYKTNMEPVDDISVGDIIEMTRTGKEFLVESITPSGIILKECTTYVSFSRSALNERLKEIRQFTKLFKEPRAFCPIGVWFGWGRCGDVPIFLPLFCCT